MSLQNCRPTRDERAGTFDTQTFLDNLDYVSQALADAVWAPTGNDYAVDIDLQKLTGSWNQGATNSNVVLTLDRTLGKQWTLRARFKIISLGAGNITFVPIGFSELDGSTGFVTGQDCIYGIIDLFNTIPFAYGMGVRQVSDGSLPAQINSPNVPINTNFAFVVGTDYYMELRRDGNFAYCQVFSDRDYSIPLGLETSIVIPGEFNDLRFLKIYNRNVISTGSGTFEVDEIQLWEPVEDRFFTADFTDRFGYSTQFDANLSWPTSDPVALDIDIDNAELDWNVPASGSLKHEQMVHDLQQDLGANPVDGSQWTLRFKFDTRTLITPDGLTSRMIFGLSSTDSTSDLLSVQDFIIVEFLVDNVRNPAELFLFQGNNTAPQGGGGTFIQLSHTQGVGVIYVELKRLSDILCELNIYADANYTELLDSAQLATTAAVDLRYLKAFTRTFGGAGLTYNGAIDDIQFWNGIVDPNLQQPNLEDDFSGYVTQAQADANWPRVGSNIIVNPTTNLIDYNIVNAPGNINIAHDLRKDGIILADDLGWTLRFKLVVTTLTQIDADLTALVIGLSNGDQNIGRNDVQDFIGVELDNSTSVTIFRTQVADNEIIASVTSDATFTTPLTTGTFFMQIRRNSRTEMTISLFSDAGFTQLIESQTVSVETGVTGLRFIKFFNSETSSPSSNTFDGTIDNIQFFDGDGETVPRGDYQSDFARDMWVDNGTLIAVNTAQKRLNFNNSGVGIDATALDLVNGTIGGIENTFGLGVLRQALAVNDKWKLRFHAVFTNLTVNTNNDIQLLGMSETNQTLSAVTGGGDALYVNIQHQGGAGSRLRLISINNGSLVNEAFQEIDWLVSTDYFFELERISETEVALRLFDSADYTNPIIELFATVPVGIEDLQFIKSGNRGGSNGDIDGFIDQVQFILNPSQVEQRFNSIREVPPDDDVTLVKSVDAPIDPLSLITPTLKLEQKNTLYDDFTQYLNQTEGDKFWPPVGTAVRVGSTGLIINWNAQDNNTTQGCERDLGFALDNDKWTMRMKFDVQTKTIGGASSSQLFVVLSDQSGVNDSSGTRDFIGFRIVLRGGAVLEKYDTWFGDGVILTSGTQSTFAHTLVVETVYIEIKKIDATHFVMSLYSDVRFRNLIESQTITVPSTIKGLRHIIITRFSSASSSNALTGIIDEVQIWDGLTDVNFQEGRLSSHLLASDEQSSYIFSEPARNVIRAIPIRQPTDVMSASIVVQDILGASPPQDVDNINWTLRFGLKTNSFLIGTGSQNLLFIGLSNGSARLNYLTSQDWLGMGIEVSVAGITYRMIVGNNTNTQTAQVFTFTDVIPAVGVTHYFELIRFDQTNFLINIYADAEFTRLLTTHIVRNVSTAITGLEFFRLVAIESTIQNSLFDCEVSDVQLFDGLPSEIKTGKLTDKLGLFTNRGGLV